MVRRAFASLRFSRSARLPAVAARGVAACAAVLAACEVAAPGRAAKTEVPADSAAGEIPFELEGPGGAAILLPVHLNGQGPFNFVLDTGATFTCVDQAVADSLDLRPGAGPRVGIGAGVSGQGQVRLVNVDSLRVGQVRAMDINACLLDLRHLRAIGSEVHGLLGLNFLKSFRMTLDFERNVVRLSAP